MEYFELIPRDYNYINYKQKIATKIKYNKVSVLKKIPEYYSGVLAVSTFSFASF
jgi:hypothetical protein